MFPALGLRLRPVDPGLIRVPSRTTKVSGAARVFSCAKARAIELLCAVAATGVIGRAPGSTQNPTNVSACAVYLPCEPSLGMDGVLGATAPTGEDSGDRPLPNAHNIERYIVV